MAEKQVVAEHVEDVDAAEAKLTTQLELLRAVAEDEEWPTEQLESAIRRTTRLFHQHLLRRAAVRYRLREENVADCMAKLEAKYPD